MTPVRPTVHTNPSRKRSCKPVKFENTALFLRLGLPSTLIRLENGAQFKPVKFKKVGFALVLERVRYPCGQIQNDQ